MTGPMPPQTPPSPGGPPAGDKPGQPPFGSSPTSQQPPQKGREAAGLARMGVIVKMLEETLPLLGVTSEPGQVVLKAIQSLAKHVTPGSVSPGVEASTMQRLLSQKQQMGPQIAAMRGGDGAPPGAGGPPGAPPPGA